MTENSERESGRKAGLDRSHDRGAYAVEEEISKRISLLSLSRVKLPRHLKSAKFGTARLLSIPPNFSRLFSRIPILFILFIYLFLCDF